MDAPASFADLAARIHEREPQLTPAHRAIAERVLRDPEGVAFLSVREAAELVRVNTSTVTRFAQSLGLPGYPAVRRLCKQHLHAQTRLRHRLDTVADSEAHLWERSARFDEQNIARSFARLDAARFGQVVQVLAEAPAVHVLGLRKSYAPAYLLWYLLQLVRERVRLLAPGVVLDQLRDVGPGDAFVAVAIHRYSQDTVLGCRYAHGHGATTVALTDNAASPLLPAADHTFLVDTAGPAVLRSMTAVTSLVQAIAGTVAARRGARSRDALDAEESLLAQFGVYHQPAPRRTQARRRPA